MTQIMLVDAEHPEELRVAVIENGVLSEFDYESTLKKQNKGNIYLAKVTRVEPSLQAAFVEYGQNRQGFLSFAEIHPDYFRIPVADRKNMTESEIGNADILDDPTGDVLDSNDNQSSNIEDMEYSDFSSADTDAGDDFSPVVMSDDDAPDNSVDLRANNKAASDNTEDTESDWQRHRRLKKQYTIQEVIKKNQILLVQVVKEERGNKGAALTTYLSLAGRYCVLMPNSGNGGGISRKIGSSEDRKYIRGILNELEVPDSISVIVRTAGMGRTKAEIKRDYEYLLRVWGQIREDTLSAAAPALIYEEGTLIRRAIRDIYDRDTDEVIVSGEAAYKDARHFMKMLMPSHSKRVKLYKDKVIPLLHRYHLESQIEEIFKPITQLPSGGYLVFGQTEALVAIDVNSGRSTRERSVEDMALHTNLEAAEEIARQLRLRDLAGLIVVDFIDMEDARKNALVERKLKDLLRKDRARVQVGRISQFGLLELSRQRLRPSIEEISSHVCNHCQGSGRMRSVESFALAILRAVEYEGLKQNAFLLKVTVPRNIALHLFNEKRSEITDIERLYSIKIRIEESTEISDSGYTIDILEKKAEGYHLPDNIEVLQEFQKDLAERQKRYTPKRRNLDKNDRDFEGERTKNHFKDNKVSAERSDNNVDSDNENATKRSDEDRQNRRRRRNRKRRDFNTQSNNYNDPQNVVENDSGVAETSSSSDIIKSDEISNAENTVPPRDKRRRSRNRYRNRRTRNFDSNQGNRGENADANNMTVSLENAERNNNGGSEAGNNSKKQSWWGKITGIE